MINLISVYFTIIILAILKHIATLFPGSNQNESSVFQYGDVAQLVRAGASYAQGRQFESDFHHQAMNEDIRAV